MPMTTCGNPRERSPAYRGAQLAFSSPSATQRSLNSIYTGSQGALVAASRVGTANLRAAGDDGPDTATRHQQNNATSSYIAANLAARLSTERLPLPSGSPSPAIRSRPAPSRAHSNMTIQMKSHRPIIHTLISRYEGDAARPRLEALQYRSNKRASSLNAQETTSIDNAIGTSHWARTKASPARSSSSSTDTSYTSATDEQLPRLRTAYRTSPSAKPPPKPIRAVVGHTHNRPQPSPTLSSSTIPQLSVSSLANAMVASSLASSRAPSPTRPPLPPPRRQHSRPHLFYRTHSAENEVGSRTPSPSKGAMRTTMRAPQDPSQDLGFKQKRNHFIHKHPNKHHEGSRERWRDQIAEFERKRYEGVWAANRGALLTHQYPSGRSSGGGADVSNSVLNLIVRDIWSRSHLPSSILEEIWNLVTSDNNEAETLGKEEFVVGMWLVDQALKGRKLPVKVSDSVWFSARGLSGIKVRREH